uniref:Uncharacterized protein n=1 Tax=Romanomermis culicivorax TaxID=13658 RepID=A0A915IHE8_ROMCU
MTDGNVRPNGTKYFLPFDNVVSFAFRSVEKGKRIMCHTSKLIGGLISVKSSNSKDPPRKNRRSSDSCLPSRIRHSPRLIGTGERIRCGTWTTGQFFDNGVFPKEYCTFVLHKKFDC